MRKSFSYLAIMLIASIFSIAVQAQTVTITGKIMNQENSESLSAVSVTVKGATSGSFTDDKGEFKLTHTGKFPITLVVSSVGFATKEIKVNSATDELNISLSAISILGQEIVVSASRLPERIIESPVTIERVSAATIRMGAAPNFYEALANLRGVDMITSSITFRTVGTRGFNGSGNLRFNQLVDGMDNQAPGLNFAVGNFLGINELDVDNVELLPGASSALYGPGGMNGTMLMTSKDPFKYQGLSYVVKQGVNHTDQKQRASAPYYDWTMRWAKVVNEKLAFKISGQFLSAQDWQAADNSNYNRSTFKSIPGNRATPDYDGVNVYGDDIKAPMLTVFDAMNAAGAFGPNGAFLRNIIPTTQEVSRTGYAERDLANYDANNFKVNGGVFYKIKPNLEASLVGFWGTGNTVYTGADRYSLRGVKMGQYKAELKAKNWFVRGYTTQENAGDAFAVNTMAIQINETWSPSSAKWFPTYIGTFIGASSTTYTNAYTPAYAAAIAVPGTTPAQADAAGIAAGRAAISPFISAYHAASRAGADVGRLVPGTQAFKDAFNKAAGTAIPQGARFLDKSDLYAAEGQYNLSSVIKVVDVLVGANIRQYSLNSEGTLFADKNGRLKINEQGGYVQLQKKFLDDKLKLTASGRYDKNSNFKGKFTPRVSAMYTIVKDNNLRVSYQTGYRFPSTQNQYIDLLVPSARLIGGLPEFRNTYNFAGNPVYTVNSVLAFGAALQAGDPNAASKLVKGVFEEFKPESVKSYEIGYRGIIAKKLMVDAYWYQSTYSNFIGTRNFMQSKPLAGPSNVFALLSSSTRQVYSTVINVPGNPQAEGFGVGLDYNVYKGFVVKASYATDTLKSIPANFESFFNTPKHRVNFGVSNLNVYKGFGFNLMFRRQSSFYYQATFGGGEIPAYETLDMMVSYRLPNSKNMIKVGGSNITNKYYRSAFGNPAIGAMYYASFGFNVF